MHEDGGVQGPKKASLCHPPEAGPAFHLLPTPPLDGQLALLSRVYPCVVGLILQGINSLYASTVLHRETLGLLQLGRDHQASTAIRHI